MAKTKYKEYVDTMYEVHKEEFENFKEIHSKYALEPDKYQDEYNEKGKPIQEILLEYEDKLCRQSEKGGYGVYTSKLAEKFREEVKKTFPEIEKIGIKRKKAFSLGQIKPSSENSRSDDTGINLRKLL
jgi:hypothetical protein